MKINQETKDKIIYFVKTQWKLVSLGGIILMVLAITLLLPSGKPGNTNQAPDDFKNKVGTSGTGNAGEDKKPFDLFGIFSDSGKKSQKDQVPADKPFPTPHLGTFSTESKLTITNIQSNGKQTTKTLSGISTASTAQGTVSTSTNIQTDVSKNEEVDNIKIVFQNPDGTTTTYIPPGTPPDEVRWGRYTNNKGKYAINFPSNWQFFYSIDVNGYEGIALYPPNTDPNSQNSPFIGFGITEKFVLPNVGDTSVAFATPQLVDGISGTLYTNGILGNSYIASVLQYEGNHFGLGSSISSATFAYVYYYMLNSLTFDN